MSVLTAAGHMELGMKIIDVENEYKRPVVCVCHELRVYRGMTSPLDRGGSCHYLACSGSGPPTPCPFQCGFPNGIHWCRARLPWLLLPILIRLEGESS